MTLNYIENILISASMIARCISISAFAFLVGIPVGITSYVVGSKKCAITKGINKYKSIIEKKKKNQDKIVLLAKTDLSSIEILIYKALPDSYVSFGEFVLLINVSKGDDEMKEEI